MLCYESLFVDKLDRVVVAKLTEQTAEVLGWGTVINIAQCAPPNSFKFSETRALWAVLFILKENKTPFLKVVRVLVCMHRSYFYTLWENNRTCLLLQPRQGDFCVGVVQKVLGSKMKPAAHREYWRSVKWLTTAWEAGDRKEMGVLDAKRRGQFFSPLIGTWPYWSLQGYMNVGE